ncbi:Uncharacterised protein [Shigella sonnei]|nr:Uncharacterised protein [Shigella sonnei]
MRCDHREARTAAGEGLDILRIEHRLCLYFIARGNQIQRLDLPDINTEIANWHPDRQFSGIESVKRNLPTNRTGRCFGSIQNSFVAFTLTGAGTAEVIEANGSL